MSTKTHHLTPAPIVEKSDLEGDVPTRSRYRTLVSKGIVSAGWQVPLRTGRGLSGSRKFHSVLSTLAVKALSAGDESSASYLGAEARRLEELFGDEVVQFLVDRPAADLPHAAFYRRLVQATDDAIDRWPNRVDFYYGAGVILAITEDDVRIDVTNKKGEEVELALPADLARIQGLDVGGKVWVLRSLTGRRATVEMIDAVDMDWVDATSPSGSDYLERGAGGTSLPADALAALARIPKGAIPVAKIKRLAG
ncbi:hypothetical protein [Nocardioides sp. WS12]|uniref:hypothetical protein n=1 Tax=Nocardioides sp. WS12 TaxID=2486272 RepID=UPI0015F81FD1|nr:hypothetical protein [Nocardioides sp. WS12]